MKINSQFHCCWLKISPTNISVLQGQNETERWPDWRCGGAGPALSGQLSAVRPRALHPLLLQEAGGEPVLRRGQVRQVCRPLRGGARAPPTPRAQSESPHHHLLVIPLTWGDYLYVVVVEYIIKYSVNLLSSSMKIVIVLQKI